MCNWHIDVAKGEFTVCPPLLLCPSGDRFLPSGLLFGVEKLSNGQTRENKNKNVKSSPAGWVDLHKDGGVRAANSCWGLVSRRTPFVAKRQVRRKKGSLQSSLREGGQESRDQGCKPCCFEL